MSKEVYEDSKDMLCRELKDITRKGDVNNRENLDDMYKILSGITMAESLIDRAHREERGEQSNAYRGDMRGSYDGMHNSMDYSGDYSNRSYPPIRIGRYSMDDNRNESYDHSEARGRDAATGRYVSRDNYDRGYSRHTAEERISEKLEHMLDTTQDPHIREAISTAMNMLK